MRRLIFLPKLPSSAYRRQSKAPYCHPEDNKYKFVEMNMYRYQREETVHTINWINTVVIVNAILSKQIDNVFVVEIGSHIGSQISQILLRFFSSVFL